jgi:hypothetical protein
MSSIKPLGPVPKAIKKEKKQGLKNYKIMNEVKADKKEKTLWKWFSLFIRLRDCPDGSYGFGPCFTCCKVDNYKNMDAGHYISRRHKNTKYDEDNVALQRVHCNRDLHGNVDSFQSALINKHGSIILTKLEVLKTSPAKKMKLWEVEAKTAEYRQKAKDEAFRVGVTI